MPSKADIIAAPYQQAYLDLLDEEDMEKAIRKNSRQFKKFLKEIPRKKINHAYAEGKWTLKEVLQHLIDAERVFSYRAVRFARKDATPLPGFDENSWVANAEAAKRGWGGLIEEFKAVRQSTELLFESFNEDQLLATGEASGNRINVLTLGFLCAAHVAHHMKIIKERYL
jgi:hypothetical protein